ncbi:MAG TPA: hypothetical protein VF051_14420 [Hyphomicrobiaceae bacterium]
MAEAILRDLPSVLGAFVREDVNGHPREVHLLVSPGPNVKLLAQDVREMLEEKLGLPVDQRVISIAQLAEDIADFGDTTIADLTEPVTPEARTRFVGVESESQDQRVTVRCRLQHGDRTLEAEAVELDVGVGRARASVAATLRAASQVTGEAVRLEIESVSIVRAFDREYVVVALIAGAVRFGRGLMHLVGAHPIEHDVESASALAALKAINRVLAKTLG